MTNGNYQQIEAYKNVIDWLNGCRALYRSHTQTSSQSRLVKWQGCYDGLSYLGTMSNGLATTGVDGLEVIIAEAGISSWITTTAKTASWQVLVDILERIWFACWVDLFLALRAGDYLPTTQPMSLIWKRVKSNWIAKQETTINSGTTALSLKRKSGQGWGGLYSWFARLERETSSRL